MSQPDITTHQTQGEKKNMSLLIRGSLWIAIGALIAAALVCVIWVLIGDQDGLIGRAFLTILLLAAFAGIAILEAGLAPNRPDWLQLASMVSWIVALLVGAVKIWLPEDGFYFGAERFFQLLLVIGILQLALLHVRLFTPAAQRYVTTFTRVIYIVTITFLAGLVGMLVFFLAFPNTFHYGELYWRIVVALTILVAVGTTLIPLLNALFAPKKKTPADRAVASPPSWPTYADGITPLPALPDASPDWNAYYTGHPTVVPPQQALAAAPVSSFPVAPQPTSPQPAAPQFTQPVASPQVAPGEHLVPPAPAAQPTAPPQETLPAFPPPPPAPQRPAQ
ncbi:hypothetical protein [Microbacterium maritypicum]|uniref:hypothetical protein n=1 Tax=Microbacterium maritypicum TaxID=33918 RepID=UPI00296ECCD4|nr:hypothetical protein [Microbacterium liquefaciens]